LYPKEKEVGEHGIGPIVGGHGLAGKKFLEKSCKLFPHLLLFLSEKDGEDLIGKEDKG
jgi:hypothetical protein